MKKWLSKFWIQIAFLDIDFDVLDCISIDILCITAGGEKGIKFQGSLFLFYWEPGSKTFLRKPHFTWDLLYTGQFRPLIKKMGEWWKS